MIPLEMPGVAERHLADDELVRRVDGELDPAEADRVEAHLAACSRCRAALAELAEISARFSSALPHVDATAVPGSASWIASTVWRAAAAIALLAGLALAIAPIRAWMAERVGLATRPAEEAPAVVEPLRTGRADDGLRIAFVPDGDPFVVRVSNTQPAGTLTLAATAGDSAVAEVAGGAPVAADLLVLPDGLRIRNDASSSADYRVTVPSDLTRVEVRIADRVAWSGSPRLLAAPHTVPIR